MMGLSFKVKKSIKNQKFMIREKFVYFKSFILALVVRPSEPTTMAPKWGL